MQSRTIGIPKSRKLGYRLTTQRQEVLAFLSNAVACMTAMEIFTALRTNMSHVSLSTVYSSLHLFVKNGWAKECGDSTDIKRYRYVNQG